MELGFSDCFEDYHREAQQGMDYFCGIFSPSFCDFKHVFI
jgi:hypothetical protein